MRITYGAPWVSRMNLLPLVLLAIVRLLCCGACGCSSPDPSPARAVVVCANGSETPRLLLNSATSAQPEGLANSSDMVGRNLMLNKGGGAAARFEHPLNEYKGANVTMMLHDFYNSDPARGFYGGGGFTARSGGPLTWGQNVPEGTPTWGPGFKEYLESYTHWMNCAGHGTSLAQPTNVQRVNVH